MIKVFRLAGLVFSVIFSLQASALTLPLPDEGNVVGSIKYVKSHAGETLADIGRRFDIGGLQMQQANPDLDPNRKMHAGITVVIPSQYILPDVPRKGIVINLAEQRLYFFPSDRAVVMTEPVGIGRKGQWQTPVGQTKVVKKVKDPYWHPTRNVRLEAAKNGTPIPYEFPPGPNNPLGRHILRLGWPTYLIHGTNQPETVGGRVSAGCIRMLPEGAEALFEVVPVGTLVTVVNQPFKAGTQDGRVLLESHHALDENSSHLLTQRQKMVETLSNIAKLDLTESWINWRLVQRSMSQKKGIPTVVGEITKSA